ncbi:MAG: undecaprenyldiphospho-muramoylpentapeptide beta-N-acetylglucosaminyltransferase [Paenibacillus dendritiformis]|uniref:undecaprenyldiphospho-muramoylpentapeptide beta-N-acetylglucosaminyltransferase n=1 Tax=uncultured Paenibacillus sp. TaxID=227322 RepID=UPI0025DC5DB9|nr:undecaprenyldiphospho-muramoylpentapeptide beta-N-acetylglucosaminyltransferase [uncultured Paenibacillus sp.]MDU5144479.1 undecaprenyldiphospho-muramoylpentapeptide beta-N-acetylglucosaminyltransferase [Paenibacillus dendritiformis]
MKNNKIVLTGGGSAGHVSVNAALIPKLLERNWDIYYIGSHEGIEREIMSAFSGVTYHGISTGKLRRYADWNNVKDPFKVLKGCGQAYALLRRIGPRIIFSKGGFVSVPVVAAGWMRRVPAVIHESDMTPGLANRIATPFATRICATFPETLQHIHSGKAEYVGAIVREELRQGDAAVGRRHCGFPAGKKVLLVMGGSLGARSINEAIRANLRALLATFRIVHICGAGQVDEALQLPGYKQFEFVHEELPHLMAMSDIVISRAGSNAIFEFLSLRKPMLLIPLPKGSSRGDQILNARSFADRGFAEVLDDADVSSDAFLRMIHMLAEKREEYVRRMESHSGDAIGTTWKLADMIERYAKR